MNNQDKIIKAAQAILNVLYEHDLTSGEALSVLDCARAVIIVDGLDNGDIDESTAERILDATALHVRQYILSRGGKNKKAIGFSHQKFPRKAEKRPITATTRPFSHQKFPRYEKDIRNAKIRG